MKIQPYKTSIPLYHTIPEFLDGIAAMYGPRPAVSWFTRSLEQKTVTYTELNQKITALRRCLLQASMPHGTHIAIASENSLDWIICFLAITSAGHVAVCVDTEQSDDSIRDMILRSDASLLFLSNTFLPICSPILQSRQISGMILMDGDCDMPGVRPLAQLYENGVHLEDPQPPVIAPEDPAEIVFTSGTTSQSKMVLLSHKGITQNTYDTLDHVNLFSSSFTSLPFYHAYGFNISVLVSLLHGLHLNINGDLKTTMRDLQLAKPDTMYAVPLMVEAIHNQFWLTAEKNGKANDLRKLIQTAKLCKKLHLPLHFKKLDELREKISPSLRVIISGGAHLNREIAEEFELLGIQVLQGYGITECSPLISVNCNYCNKLGSVGLPMSSCQLRLEDGEVCVKGPSVMLGYYKAEEETADVLSPDGWFRTGDLGYLDKDGFLYLTGRKKNLIVFKNGKKVSPEKLEELISAVPMVKEVLVTGTANGAFADDVKLTASIYPDPERSQHLSSYEILEHLQREVDNINSTLPSYQQVQLVNIREKEFSKTGTKKIKRHGD